MDYGMKVGDLVRVKPQGQNKAPRVEESWTGIITEFSAGLAIVFWSEQYPEEEEYLEQIEVISESR
jgi:hypothetical protein